MEKENEQEIKAVMCVFIEEMLQTSAFCDSPLPAVAEMKGLLLGMKMKRAVPAPVQFHLQNIVPKKDAAFKIQVLIIDTKPEITFNVKTSFILMFHNSKKQ